MSKPTPKNNFGRVFELPEHYPEGHCFRGGRPVEMLMVDWFNPWPENPFADDSEEPETWTEVVALLLPWLSSKIYVKPGRKYILITDFGESLIFEKQLLGGKDDTDTNV